MNIDEQRILEERACKAVNTFNVNEARTVSNEAIQNGADIVSLINNGFTKGIQEIGELYDQKKLFLPHMMAASSAMTAGVDILTPVLGNTNDGVRSIGNVVICTIEGDIHSIGKDICAIMLKVAGFNVHNIGKDVKLMDIIKACKDYDARIVGTSALMTSTMVGQKTFEELLQKEGLKGKTLSNVGGAPVTQQWADEIGADIYSENANDCAVKIRAAIEG